MVKFVLLPCLALIASSAFIKPAERPDYRSFLNVEENERGNYTLTGIKSGYLSNSNIRIYAFDDPIDAISDDAFLNTTFDSIVLSKDITFINDAAFTNAPNIKNIYYTGSLDDFALLNLSFDTNHVYPYSVDEGFINYWNTYIRPTENTNICNITKQTFSYAYGLYINLIQSDLDVVNQYVDLAGAKISDSMKTLISVFSEQGSQKKKDEWNQTGAITLIIVISVVGMTSIAIFFLLKTKKIID